MTPVTLEDLDPNDKESNRWYYTGKSVAEVVQATRELLQPQLEEAPLEAELLVRTLPAWTALKSSPVQEKL